MLMHFVSTGYKFPYGYYIGLMSAAKVGDVKLWYIHKASSEYFSRAVSLVPSEQISCPEFPALQGRSEHFNFVSKFDYLIWKIIAEQGGSVMGLDSITLRPFHNLLGDKEILVGCDAETVPDSYCMHGATVNRGSEIASKIHEDSIKALRGEEIVGRHRAFRDGALRFGGAGIIPFINNVYENMDSVAVAEFGVLGGYMHDGSPFYLYEPEGQLLHKDCRTIPFYATWQSKKFDNITKESIRGTLLGKLVEGIGI